MKYLKYLRIGLLLLGLIVTLAAMLTFDKDAVDHPELSFALTTAYLFMGATCLLALLMPLIGIVQNPRGAMKSMIGMAMVILVIIITHAMASEAPVTLADGTIFDNVTAIKFTDTSLYTMYFAMGALMLTIVSTEIYKIFK